MLNQYSRTELVFGKEGVQTLLQKTVAVLGAGGVGSFAMEALARTGIGRLILIDKDEVDITNCNRQLPALVTTVGQSKVEVMRERLNAVNPDCDVIAHRTFFLEDTKDVLFQYPLDYVVDAIDILTAKMLLIEECVKRKIPIVSSMGAANKLDPTRFRVVDLFQTRVDPIAKVLRRELRKRGVKPGDVKTVCSTEQSREPLEEVRQAIVPADVMANSPIRKSRNPPGSTAYVPSVAGLILASVVIHDLTGVYPEPQ